MKKIIVLIVFFTLTLTTYSTTIFGKIVFVDPICSEDGICLDDGTIVPMATGSDPSGCVLGPEFCFEEIGDGGNQDLDYVEPRPDGSQLTYNTYDGDYTTDVFDGTWHATINWTVVGDYIFIPYENDSADTCSELIPSDERQWFKTGEILKGDYITRSNQIYGIDNVIHRTDDLYFENYNADLHDVYEIYDECTKTHTSVHTKEFDGTKIFETAIGTPILSYHTVYVPTSILLDELNEIYKDMSSQIANDAENLFELVLAVYDGKKTLSQLLSNPELGAAALSTSLKSFVALTAVLIMQDEVFDYLNTQTVDQIHNLLLMEPTETAIVFGFVKDYSSILPETTFLDMAPENVEYISINEYANTYPSIKVNTFDATYDEFLNLLDYGTATSVFDYIFNLFDN